MCMYVRACVCVVCLCVCLCGVCMRTVCEFVTLRVGRHYLCERARAAYVGAYMRAYVRV